MAVYNEADFVMQGREVKDPEIAKDELELYYDVKGKKNSDVHKNKLLDMSGQGKDGELSGFDYDGELSGYIEDNGLVFDGIDDTLKRTVLEGLSEDSFTYQLNNNIIAFDGNTVRWVKDGKVMERKGINLIKNSNFRNNLNDWHIRYGKVTITPCGALMEGIRDDRGPRIYTEGEPVISVDELTENNIFLVIATITPCTESKVSIRTSRHSRGYDSDIIRDVVLEPNKKNNIIEVFEANRLSYAQRMIDDGGGSLFIESVEAKSKILIHNIQLINLTATFGAGNEPMLEEIQAEPDKWQWLPNPMDLLKATELKGNILGDMEDIVDASPRDRQSGKEIFTEHADDSHVHVEVDGKSYQHAGSGKNLCPVSTFTGEVLRVRETRNTVNRVIVHNIPISPNSTYTLSGIEPSNLGLVVFATTTKVDENINEHDQMYMHVTGGGIGISKSSRVPVGYNYVTITTGGSFDNSYHSIGDSVTWSNIQLEEGSPATPYEPPAPTPDYPIEIHSLNDFDVVSQKSESGTIDGAEVGATNEKNTMGSEDKIYPLQSLDDWSRYYTNSPAIVTNPNDIAYQEWSFSGVPLENMEQVRGGMFGSAFPVHGNLNGGIDTPATAWAGINISRMYLETNDATLLPKIRAIGDFFISHTMDIDIWGTPLKAFPNALTFDEVSRQWIPSTRFIHTRTFYHVAWALLEIYDATGDTKYSNLAGQLLDGATIPQLMTTGQANSNELPPYFSGAMFNTINNVGETSYEPDWVTFTNTNGDMVVRATNKWIELFGNTTRTSFDLYEEVDVNYTVKSIADNYINHLVYLYNNQELRKPDGHNLMYCFSHYEWEDEPHPDGYMIPVPMNWDFIDEVFGQDQWFTGDLMFWAIIGFAEAGETQIATSLLDKYYELKAPDSEGRLLFHDRYTAQGTPLIDDTSKSIAFTGLYMQARNILGNHDYDAESLSALKYYQKKSVFNTVDGGFSWDTEDYNSFIENKTLGEVLFSIMENVTETEPPEDITEDTNHPLIDKINLSLSEPLRSVGDVKDRLFRDSDGLWKIERRVWETFVDGSGNWQPSSISNRFDLPNILPYQSRGSNYTIHSSHYPYINPNISDSVWVAGGALRIRDARYSNTEELKSFLKSEYDRGTPFTVVYQLETPIIETLDQELQDKLNTLKSFKGSNYVYTVQNKDNPHKEQLKPTLRATFNSKDYLKETRTLTNLLIWARELSNEELIHHNQLFLNRFNLPSDRVVEEPIEQTLNLLHGGMVGHSLEQNYTINI